MELAIGIIIVGVVLIIIGLVMAFSKMKNFVDTGLDLEGGSIPNPFSGKIILAFVFHFLGAVSLLIGFILLVISLAQ